MNYLAYDSGFTGYKNGYMRDVIYIKRDSISI